MITDTYFSNVITYLSKAIYKIDDIDIIRKKSEITSPGFNTYWYNNKLSRIRKELSELESTIIWSFFFSHDERNSRNKNKFYNMQIAIESYLGDEDTPKLEELMLGDASTLPKEIVNNIKELNFNLSFYDKLKFRKVFNFLSPRFRGEINRSRRYSGISDVKVKFIKGEEINYRVVKVCFVTDRIISKKQKKTTFTGSPNLATGDPSKSLSYGVCKVSIPYNHEVGKLETPRLDFLNQPGKYVTLLSTDVKLRSTFYRLANSSEYSDRSAFIFIHGFNTKFADAAKRTAQIYYDLKFSGLPIFYSWPSKGGISSYPSDEENARWSERNLEFFIKEFIDTTNVANLYLIAHSMGNRVLTGATISLLSKDPSYGSRIKEVILAAPDIDARTFKRDIVPALSQHSSLTLYASSKDRALIISKLWHSTPRAGEAGDNLVLRDGLETIDASNVNSELFALRHSYNFTKRTMLNDLSELIKGFRPPQRFELERMSSSQYIYWRLRK